MSFLRKFSILALSSASVFVLSLVVDPTPADAKRRGGFGKTVAKTATKMAVKGAARSMSQRDNDDAEEGEEAVSSSVQPTRSATAPMGKAEAAAERARRVLAEERGVEVLTSGNGGSSSATPPAAGIVCIAGCYR
jgi:hypothetical protein